MKLTHQRLEIFRELAKTEDHPNAEMIFRAVQERVPTVSLDTVYRTLWMLRDRGLFKAMGMSRDGVRFDASLEPHHHYVCVSSGLVRDFQSEALNNLPVRAAVKNLGSFVEAQVEVRGLCASCRGIKARSESRARVEAGIKPHARSRSKEKAPSKTIPRSSSSPSRGVRFQSSIPRSPAQRSGASCCAVCDPVLLSFALALDPRSCRAGGAALDLGP